MIRDRLRMLPFSVRCKEIIKEKKKKYAVEKESGLDVDLKKGKKKELDRRECKLSIEIKFHALWIILYSVVFMNKC